MASKQKKNDYANLCSGLCLGSLGTRDTRKQGPPGKKHEGQVCCDASQKSVNFNEDRGL